MATELRCNGAGVTVCQVDEQLPAGVVIVLIHDGMPVCETIRRLVDATAMLAANGRRVKCD